MNVKILGAVVIIITCGGIGFHMSKIYSLQEQQLDELIQAFEYIKCELQYRLTPLAVQFQQCSTITSGSISAFFSLMTSELEAQISPNAKYCLTAALNRSTGLTSAAVQVLSYFGKTLGAFDFQGQLSCVNQTIVFSQEILNRLKHNHTAKTRNYQTLGLCTGAALVVLFI